MDPASEVADRILADTLELSRYMCSRMWRKLEPLKGRTLGNVWSYIYLDCNSYSDLGSEKVVESPPGFLRAIAFIIPGLIFSAFFSILAVKYYEIGGVWVNAAYASLFWVSIGILFLVFGFRRLQRFYRSLPPDSKEMKE